MTRVNELNRVFLLILFMFLLQQKKNTSNAVGNVNIDENTMNRLLGNMDNLTTTVQGLKENYEKVSVSFANFLKDTLFVSEASG